MVEADVINREAVITSSTTSSSSSTKVFTQSCLKKKIVIQFSPLISIDQLVVEDGTSAGVRMEEETVSSSGISVSVDFDFHSHLLNTVVLIGLTTFWLCVLFYFILN